ncbi:hypothetical protein NECAME_01610 [Necator americanus]|uniref:Uncharacterized protein n=1 Tax=Necator americanus TaxID=51031 RepID=W2TTL0_NECAM|nr:hypothetical protein NECAME_01610 [Necator americanus]ETN84387.1 hypothetical protein NECAME_01610 [Necator americanus]
MVQVIHETFTDCDQAREELPKSSVSSFENVVVKESFLDHPNEQCDGVQETSSATTARERNEWEHEDKRVVSKHLIDLDHGEMCCYHGEGQVWLTLWLYWMGVVGPLN